MSNDIWGTLFSSCQPHASQLQAKELAPKANLMCDEISGFIESRALLSGLVLKVIEGVSRFTHIDKSTVTPHVQLQGSSRNASRSLTTYWVPPRIWSRVWKGYLDSPEAKEQLRVNLLL